MMSDTEIDKFFDDLKDRFKRIIDDAVERKLEPFRALILNEITPEPQVGPLVDALAVAELIGCDLSTPKSKEAAKQKVYNLVRNGNIPSVRISKRRLKFDLEKVKQKLALGGAPVLLLNNSSLGTTSSLHQ
jgi:hypothetical protein